MKRLISILLVVLLTVSLLPQVSIISLAVETEGVYCNGTDYFVAEDGTEFFINSDDEDKLYQITPSGEVSLAVDEHTILLVNNGDTAYLVVFRNEECKLVRFDASSGNSSDIYTFPDAVCNIALRSNELLYTLDGAAYALNLATMGLSVLKESGINTIYFDENDDLAYVSSSNNDNSSPDVSNELTNSRGLNRSVTNYSPRLTAPATDNPYYTTLNVFYNSGYGMAPNIGNCTCYAFGRSYENLGTEPMLCHNNAGDWYAYNKNKGYYQYGSSPILGSVAVWKSGGAGHVAVVEVINGDSVITSESGWQSFYFKTVTRSASNSNFSASSYYSFQGFIYVLGKNVSSGPPAGIPQNVCATQKDAYVVGVSWDAAANATSYDVYLIQSPYGWDDVKYSTSISADYSYTEFNGVAAGDYAVFVIARPNDDTAQSSWVSVTVNNDAPSAPTIFASDEWTKTGSVLSISWDAIPRATGYEYYMAEYPYAYAYEKYTYTDTVTGTSVSFNASSLPNGSYCFFMHAKNAAGSSPQSNWLYFDVYNGDYTPTKVEMYNGHIYALYEQDLSWTFAEKMCENAGGHLATITSQAENNFICNLIQSGSKDAYWIGARSDRSGSWYNSDNPFEWVTGEALCYTSWYPGEPSGSGTGGDIEHFAEIRKSYNNQWNDKPNYRTADDGFILEVDATSWQPTATATYGFSKYLLFDAGVPWSEARAYCDANGGHLATISSTAEDAAITNLLKQGTLAWFYLGGRSVGGTWKWVDNTTIPLSGSYSNWSDSTGAAQTGPTGWGDYLMKYKSTGTWIGMPNYDNPVDHLKHLGFVMEIDNAVNTVTFNPNGGSVSPTSKQIVYGDPYGELPTPTYGSNTFEGWFTAASGGEKITAATIVNAKANQTLYAHWIDGCADGHDYSYVVSLEPTTTATGVLTGTCSQCDGTTTVTLPKLNTTDYTYTVVTSATCTANGTGRYAWKTTTYGTFTFDVTIPKTSHSYTYAVTTAPTTSTVGVLTGTCSKCGSITTVALPKLDTTNYNYTVVTAATCTANGTGRYTWKTTTYGTFTFDVTIPKTGHNYVDTVTAPTCTEQGYTTHTCSRCSDNYMDSYVAALGHDFGAWTQTKAPTCTEKGEEKRTCSRCDAFETREIVALGHDYQAVVTAPTCTAGGYTTYTCSRCGDSYVADEAAALGHTLGAAVEENRVNPTCATNGGFDTVTYCSVCGVELSRVHTDLAALGHVWNDGVINPAATCTSDGVKTFTCQRCGETKTEAIAATGHTAGESAKENEVAATCATAGGYDMVIRCTVCNAILYTEHFEIAALIHDYQAVVTAPTCTEGGYTTYICSRCVDSYVADETAALGHDWNEPEYVWADDYSTVTATRTCKNDANHVETETVNTTSEVTKEATYEEEGEITYTALFENAAFSTQTKTVATPKLDGPKPYEPCNGGEDCPGRIFTDMPAKGNWAHDAIDWAIVNKITAGTSATTFSPNAGCTRAQVVTFLWRAAGEPEPTANNNPFTDVKEGTFYYKAVLWAVGNKVTAGTSATTFSPDATCTRAQIVTFLWRFEGEPASTTTNNPFTDVKAGAYYEKAVLWASETGVTAGTSATTFSPDVTCTRAQVVTFLYRDMVK